MLMTPMTPKVMARPIAASSSTEPSEMPYQMFWPADQTASELLMRGDRLGRGVLQRAFGGRLERGQQRQRLAVAAAAEHVDRRELVGFGEIGDQHGRGARLLEPRLDLGVGLLGDRRIQRGDRRRIGIAEHVFGRGKPHGRIGRAERQRAQHVADDAAQPVVDLDLGELGLGRLAGRLRR